MGGRSSSRWKQKMPTAVASAGWQNAKTGGGGEDDHIPDLPPPLPSPPLPSANGGNEMSGGGGIGTEGDVEGTDGNGTGLAEEDEEEEEPLNSGDDVTDEELESLFESDNLVVCQYEKVGTQQRLPRWVLFTVCVYILVLFTWRLFFGAYR